jgi:hypothetical protein
MTWTRLSDDATDRPEILALPRTVRLLHIEALVWCNRHLTDGRIPRHALPRLTDEPEPYDAAKRLVEVGLWWETEHGWQIDWTDQETAETVRNRREQTTARTRRSRKHRAGDHSECDPKWCRNGATNAVTNTATNAVSHGTPSRPVPTRPVPTPREGSGTWSGTDGTDDVDAGAPSRRPPPSPEEERSSAGRSRPSRSPIELHVDMSGLPGEDRGDED